MAKLLPAFNNNALIFWSIALILSSSLAIRGASLDSPTQTPSHWSLSQSPTTSYKQQKFNDDQQHLSNTPEAYKLAELIAKAANVDSIYKTKYDPLYDDDDYSSNVINISPGFTKTKTKTNAKTNTNNHNNNNIKIIRTDDPLVKILGGLSYDDSNYSNDLIADNSDLYDGTFYDESDSSNYIDHIDQNNNNNNNDYLIDYYRQLLASLKQPANNEQQQQQQQQDTTKTTNPYDQTLFDVPSTKQSTSPHFVEIDSDIGEQQKSDQNNIYNNNKQDEYREHIFSDGIEDNTLNNDNVNTTTLTISDNTIQQDVNVKDVKQEDQPLYRGKSTKIFAEEKDPKKGTTSTTKEINVVSMESSEEDIKNNTSSSKWFSLPSSKSIGSWMSNIFGFHSPGTSITETIATNNSKIEPASDKLEKRGFFGSITSYLTRKIFGTNSETKTPPESPTVVNKSSAFEDVIQVPMNALISKQLDNKPVGEPGMADNQLIVEFEKQNLNSNKIVPMKKDDGHEKVKSISDNKQQAFVADKKAFTFNRGQEESDNDIESNNNNSQDQSKDQQQYEPENNHVIIDKINIVTSPIEPTKANHEQNQQNSSESNPIRRSDNSIGFIRNYWNKLFSGAPKHDDVGDLDDGRQETTASDSNIRSEQLSNKVLNQPEQQWGLISKDVKSYEAPERQNLLRKSSMQINSDDHNGYSQQRLYSGGDTDDLTASESTKHFVFGDGDEAVMSHLDGYSRKYRLPADYGYGPDDHMIDRRPSTMNASNDIYFIVLVAAFCGMAIAVVLSAGLFAFKVQQGKRMSSDSDYPTYGVVGPSIQNKGSGPYNGGTVSSVGSTSKSSGSLKSLADILSPVENGKINGGNANNNNTINGDANSNNQRQYQTNQNAARMYHYQHQKQQMLSTDRVSSARHTSASDLDSDEENEEGNYTVYECPGLASTHEMEVKNPLFQDDPTPVGSPTITK